MSTKKNDEMRAKLLLKPKTEDAIAALIPFLKHIITFIFPPVTFQFLYCFF